MPESPENDAEKLAKTKTDERYKKDLRDLAKEAEYEQEHVTIFKNHVAFIVASTKMNAGELLTGITALTPLKKPLYDGLESTLPLLPEDHDDNLFNIILCSKFDDKTKLDALNLLFDRGYPRHKLFERPPIYQLFQQGKAFDKLIWDYYSSYKHGPALIPYYQAFWERFIKHDEDYTQHTAEILHKSGNVQAQIDFATFWIKSLNTVEKIKTVSQFYDSMYVNNGYATYIDKMAEHQLLAIELNKPVIQQALPSKTQSVKNAEITSFLTSHRSACCSYLSRSTPAEKIYKQIIGNELDEARRNLKNEQDKMSQKYQSIIKSTQVSEADSERGQIERSALNI